MIKMQFSLPQYSGKDHWVLGAIILPYTLCMNFIIFGLQYLDSAPYFLAVSTVTIIAFSLFFTACGAVAVLLKNRFPAEEQTVTRLGFIIGIVLIMSALFLLLLFGFYEGTQYFHFKATEETFVWSFFALGISQIFLTFLHEGIARHERWKQHRDEMEKLRTIYQRSRLQGLRSQVNPHFLFNSLNSLSSLISEEGDEAEKFLDEMSKVYRYMLRSESDILITLEEELKFLQSYNYLLRARYGSGLQLQLQADNHAKQKMIAPLALQAIVENAFTLNSISKTSPLVISIATKDDEIIIQHNLQPKTITDDFDAETALDNVISKYNLLSSKGASVEETACERTIRLPLLKQQKEAAI